jgi:hypothetical protein
MDGARSRGQTEMSALLFYQIYSKKIKSTIDKPSKVCYNTDTKKER